LFYNITGPSANISFMRIILRAVAENGALLALFRPSAPQSTGIGSGGMININPLQEQVMVAEHSSLRSSQLPVKSIMPPRDDSMEKLIQEYFANTGLLFPYIHKISFIETYRHFKQSGYTGVRRAWLALLNIILAMATRADAGREDTNRVFADSDVFYRRAEELCKPQMIRGTTLETGTSKPLRSQNWK
jgi:hypothetical protein